ncbi:hypothetical protein [Aquisphaera insulae]|uniref:hypothetical protein n=1 Tax=Aquisphaera insulae TaxID=2712864 RepID=UPI0013EB2C34|nr:hypothetical protein [Aquisphaera insulae]
MISLLKNRSRLMTVCSLVACLLLVGCDSGSSTSGPSENTTANNAALKAAIEKNMANNKAAQPQKKGH